MCVGRVGTKICWDLALQEFDTPAFKPSSFRSSLNTIMFLMKLRHLSLLNVYSWLFRPLELKSSIWWRLFFLFLFFFILWLFWSVRGLGWTDFQWRDRKFPGFNKNVFVFQKWNTFLWVWSNRRGVMTKFNFLTVDFIFFLVLFFNCYISFLM